MEWIVPFVLLAALFAPLLHRALPDRSGAALALVPGLVALLAVFRQPAVARGEIEAFRASWIPSLGIDWAFRVDGLANLFVLLVAGIGCLAALARRRERRA